MHPAHEAISTAYKEFIRSDKFPCIAAKATVQREEVRCFVAGHMGCPASDKNIVAFLYDFVDVCRGSESLFHSAVVVFNQQDLSEESFDTLMWQRLQAIADLDAGLYPYDHRVSSDVTSPGFSFSLKSEAFFIIGLHPCSSRPGRRFKYPALVFNPHNSFSRLRERGQYDKMKKIVRKNDMQMSGSINPMLDDFGQSSEVSQYSGQQYSSSWQCPLHIRHGKTDHTSA